LLRPQKTQGTSSPVDSAVRTIGQLPFHHPHDGL
jgi:hypothetical protein